MTSFLTYWGKAKPGEAGAPDAAQWHLLPYHCLDVAASGWVYLQKAGHVRALLQERLGMSERDLLAWMAFWLALHDLGKFATTFQGQRNDILEQLQARRSRHEYTVRHDSLGMLFWAEVLEDEASEEGWFGPQTGTLMEGARYWARAVTGHHGQPPKENLSGLKPHFELPADHRAAMQFVNAMRQKFLADIDFAQPCFQNPARFLHDSQMLSWWVAGVSVLADWLGSNQDHFRYVDQPGDLDNYWQGALQTAERALDEVGVLPVASRPAMRFEELFPRIATPSPLQSWASDVAIAQGPQIHLLEDVTGAGKTEAAMMLTHRLMSSGVADGFYIGLPTMATANAMYGRLSHFYAQLFDGMASLTLANGQRDLVEAFAASVLAPGQPEHDVAQADETASARCTAWLADHNKRALLAPAGVGTIDQALMAALQGKHQSLRLLGLFRKVLVVDEVHACDAYMQGVLERVLRCHAYVGGSAILLSATLPHKMKQALLDAFASGASSGTAPQVSEQGYPLVTSWTAVEPGRLTETVMATRPDVSRTVALRYVSDIDEVEAGIRVALAEGRCVCWMRNTVAEALDVHARFAAEMAEDKLMLFHARFSLRDRLDMEGRVLYHFGASSKPEDRRGRLVIATQVAEQSLDADWDLVISDLAPIDRLIQRAGRLQRHPRDAHGERLDNHTQPDGRGKPCMWVHGPSWQASPTATWFKDAFPKSSKVYRHHGQLWLTARLVQEGQMRMPHDARHLIEGVFGEDVVMPTSLQALAVRVEGEEMGEASQAQCNTIKLDCGYARASVDWWEDARTPSRLGEPSMSVLLARWRDGRLLPWVEHDHSRHAWAYSTVRVPQRLISASADPEEASENEEWQRVVASLPDQGKWSVLLPLRQTEQGWQGEALATQGVRQVRRAWVYDPLYGLKPFTS
ncbi:MAG: CRISPR-associated helicase Cas3' [Aquabacterium sp.]